MTVKLEECNFNTVRETMKELIDIINTHDNRYLNLTVVISNQTIEGIDTNIMSTDTEIMNYHLNDVVVGLAPRNKKRKLLKLLNS